MRGAFVALGALMVALGFSNDEGAAILVGAFLIGIGLYIRQRLAAVCAEVQFAGYLLFSR